MVRYQDSSQYYIRGFDLNLEPVVARKVYFGSARGRETTTGMIDPVQHSLHGKSEWR
jgi:hypothetical protein